MGTLTMLVLLTLPGEDAVKPTAAFPAERQWAALTATVRITNPDREQQGSGVILGRRGHYTYVLTARHLVAGTRSIEIATFTRKSYPRPHALHDGARVIAEAAGPDLAVVRFTTDDAPPDLVSVCPLDAVPSGKDAPVLTVGCDQGKSPVCRTATLGEKKRIRRGRETETCLAWEQQQLPEKGRSGGPLLDIKGRLLGICSGRAGGKGYYSHLSEIRRFLEKSDLGFLLKAPGQAPPQGPAPPGKRKSRTQEVPLKRACRVMGETREP